MRPVQHLRGELVRADVGERAVPPPDRRANGVDDVRGAGHSESIERRRGGRFGRHYTHRVATTAIERKLLIDGEWVETGDWLEVHSPFDGSLVGRVARGGAAEARRAVDAAERAMAEPLPAHERAAILDRTARLVEERADEVARTISAEAGKPMKAARVEVARATSTFTMAAVEARKLAGDVVPMDASPAGVGKIASRCGSRSASSVRSLRSTSPSTSSPTRSRPPLRPAARSC